MKLRIAALCFSVVALAVPAAFSVTIIEAYPTCDGATPTASGFAVEAQFVMESNDFDLSSCNNAMDAGADVVSCFEIDTVDANCQLAIEAQFGECSDGEGDSDSDDGCGGSQEIGVAAYMGTCSSSPGPCQSSTGLGSASIEPVVSDGDLFCVVVASPNTQQEIILVLDELEGECELTPVELQSFEVGR